MKEDDESFSLTQHPHQLSKKRKFLTNQTSIINKLIKK